MGMDRMLQRLHAGKPLRVGEVAELTGFSSSWVKKCMGAGALRFVQAHEGGERRVPVSEAKRLMESLGLPVVVKSGRAR